MAVAEALAEGLGEGVAVGDAEGLGLGVGVGLTLGSGGVGGPGQLESAKGVAVGVVPAAGVCQGVYEGHGGGVGSALL